jgi:hypothetical protein
MQPRYEIVQDCGVWVVMKGDRFVKQFATRAEAAAWVRMMTGGR